MLAEHLILPAIAYVEISLGAGMELGLYCKVTKFVSYPIPCFLRRNTIKKKIKLL